MGLFGSIGVENDFRDFKNFLDLWRGKIQFHILVNVDSNAWKFFICISSNSNFTKRQHSSTLLFSQVLFHSLRLKVVYIFYSALFFCGAVFGSNHALQYLSYPSQVSSLMWDPPYTSQNPF